MDMEKTWFVKNGVSKGAVADMLKKAQESGISVHGLEIFRGDECLVRLAPPPYEPTDKRQLYSLSKSFCSTAFGFCVTDGLISLDTRVLDVFPDKAPAIVTPWLDKMTFRHVISMNAGFERCTFPEVKFSDDGVKTFLSLAQKYEPGTHFVYNTAATYVVGAAVERLTGERLMDFLQRRFFTPAGITGNRWHTTADGIAEGGCGLHASVDDIAALGRLYLGKGVYEGKRYLSEKWVSDASSFISDNSMNGSPDWCAGYGCQFWRNAREGFRGDGACGQLCVVLPESNMVIAQVAEGFDMQKEMDLLFEMKGRLFDADTVTDAAFSAFLSSMYTEFTSPDRALPHEGETYVCEENVQGITQFSLCKENGKLSFTFCNGERVQSITAGCGEWVDNRFRGKYMRPTLKMLCDGKEDDIRAAACYRITETGVELILRNRLCPHFMKYLFTLENDTVSLRFEAFADFTIEETKPIIGRIRG